MRRQTKLPSAILCLLLISLAVAPDGMAEPIAGVHWSALCKKPRNIAQEKIDERSFIGAMCEGTNYVRTITKPIPAADKVRLRSTKSTFAEATGAADQTVFNDPHLFTELKNVGLRSEQHNEVYLKALTINYPHITSLTVTQTKPLSDSALCLLSRFHELKYLQLDCPVRSPSLMTVAIPRQIATLQIANNWPLPELPLLRVLDINYCRVDASFIDKIRAPKLEYLSLNRVDLARGSFQTISRFGGLLNVNIYNSNVDRTDVVCLRSLQYADVSVSAASDYYESFRTRGDSFFKKHNIVEAIGHYRETAFSEPTVYLYLQLARCYVAMREPALALDHCDLAASIDPTNQEICTVRAIALKQSLR
jgi:tetratricopeptide (TPR) repeat protein